jgi:hypothetical protein
MATLLESNGKPGMVHVSESCYHLQRPDSRIQWSERLVVMDGQPYTTYLAKKVVMSRCVSLALPNVPSKHFVTQ